MRYIWIVSFIFFNCASSSLHRNCIRPTDEIRWHYFSIVNVNTEKNEQTVVHGISIFDYDTARRQIWFNSYPNWIRQWTDTNEGFLMNNQGKIRDKQDVLFHYDTKSLQDAIKKANKVVPEIPLKVKI